MVESRVTIGDPATPFRASSSAGTAAAVGTGPGPVPRCGSPEARLAARFPVDDADAAGRRRRLRAYHSHCDGCDDAQQYLHAPGGPAVRRGGGSTWIRITNPQFSQAEVSAAKDHLCKVFDLSVRGQEGQGGFRVQGNVNVPIVLRALNSTSALQNALTPAVPSDLAAAARRYIAATLDVTTAAMGNAPTSEVNRLTDVDGDAIDAFLDSCGLPR